MLDRSAGSFFKSFIEIITKRKKYYEEQIKSGERKI